MPRCSPGTSYPRFVPATCPHCEYDRRFPGFEAGGWMQQDNNGPIVSCPMCNDGGKFPFGPYEQEDRERQDAQERDYQERRAYAADSVLLDHERARWRLP